MSARRSNPGSAQRHALVFAALGDERRLALVARLASGEPCSISQLTRGLRVTRQAVRKHLRVLERAGIVRGIKRGRENRFQFRPQPIAEMREYLQFVSQQWDEALTRLQSFVER